MNVISKHPWAIDQIVFQIFIQNPETNLTIDDVIETIKSDPQWSDQPKKYKRSIVTAALSRNKKAGNIVSVDYGTYRKKGLNQ